LNEKTLNKYFGGDWKKGGFFSPEMAYSKIVAKTAQKLNYRWIIMDELGFPTAKNLSGEKVYKIKDVDDFSVFFRERNLSFTILSAQIGTIPAVLRYLGPRLEKNEYVVTAMDGETFGHHRPGLEVFLLELLREEKIEPIMISDVFRYFSQTEEIGPRDSTWAVTKRDLKENAAFSRWKSADNVIQKKQWQLTDLAIETANRQPRNERVRTMLDAALHSDQYWWASARPWWSLEMIERGAHELKTVIKESPKAAPEEKQLAEEWYRDIVYTGFEWQRTGLVDEISRKEDEEIRERLEEKEKLFITKEEYKQMIKTLEEQMRIAAQAEEYHRAAMIKDRIRELREEMEKAKA
jgi:alpha-amylase/alpha-mannosidase (GH57 family)